MSFGLMAQLMAAGAGGGGPALPYPPDYASAPTLYLPFDGSYDDETNSRLNQTGAGSSVPSFSSSVKKFGDYALLLAPSAGATSTESLVPRFLDSADFTIGSSVDFTIEAWVRFTRLDQGPQAIIAHSHETSNQRAWRLSYLDSPEGIRFSYSTAGSSFTNIDGAASIDTDTWYHVAVSRSGSTIRLFLDGVQIGTGSDSSAFFNSTSNIYIGSTGASDDWPLFGYIDDVAFKVGYARYTTDFTPQIVPAWTVPLKSLVANLERLVIFKVNDGVNVANLSRIVIFKAL